ncbi:glyoxalase [Pilimelia anulata]|uniref:Glyoxalase n=1 Tax=Pilimelia anulata TaxID=53371 RepID=A0A8J3B9Q5_9ACTN|nr:VOC family protein [Pilimelia anulata]GGJ99279.1 glyoxalase [Pilimelia anulata]
MDWKLELVVVPVSDIDRAKRFYAEQVGFAVDHDSAISPTIRIIQLTPPGSGCSISISQGLSDMAPGSIKGLQLVVTDIDAARVALLEGGVNVSGVQHFAEGGVLRAGRGGRWNSFLFFADPDGNSWAVQERPVGGGD